MGPCLRCECSFLASAVDKQWGCSGKGPTPSTTLSGVRGKAEKKARTSLPERAVKEYLSQLGVIIKLSSEERLAAAGQRGEPVAGT